jgi:hypothetical protein
MTSYFHILSNLSFDAKLNSWTRENRTIKKFLFREVCSRTDDTSFDEGFLRKHHMLRGTVMNGEALHQNSANTVPWRGTAI